MGRGREGLRQERTTANSAKAPLPSRPQRGAEAGTHALGRFQAALTRPRLSGGLAKGPWPHPSRAPLQPILSVGAPPHPPRLGALSAERWPCSLLHCPPADTPLVGIRKHRNVRLQAREQRQLGHKHPACRQEPPYPGGEHSLLQLEPQEPPEL